MGPERGYTSGRPETAGQAYPMTLRARYETAVTALRERAAELRRDGVPADAIARAVHAERLRLAAHFKALTPEPYRTRIFERTVRVYGNALGPSIEFLRARDKSWEAIIESATRPGPPVGLDPEPESGAGDPSGTTIER